MLDAHRVVCSSHGRAQIGLAYPIFANTLALASSAVQQVHGEEKDQRDRDHSGNEREAPSHDNLTFASVCPYSTGCPDSTSTSTISPDTGASTSFASPKDATTATVLPFSTCWPTVSGSPASRTNPTTGAVISTRPSSGSSAGFSSGATAGRGSEASDGERRASNW